MSYACPKCHTRSDRKSEGRNSIRKSGRFYRKSDGQWVQRYRCGACRFRFSSATFHVCFRQKKRHKNFEVFKHLGTGSSLRNIAKVLCINRTTVARKLIFLGALCRQKLDELNASKSLVQEFEFDDLETFEHTKCKPLSVAIAVEFKTRRILGFEVAQMPATGKLAAKSVQKYGIRKDQRRRGRRKLFKKIAPFVAKNAVIRSDRNPHYPAVVKEFFPHATHQTVKGRKPSSTGQGELKKVVFDPIFSLNHTCAMFRYSINRLIRKTWCTTKLAERLRDHIGIYVVYHNSKLFKV